MPIGEIQWLFRGDAASSYLQHLPVPIAIKSQRDIQTLEKTLKEAKEKGIKCNFLLKLACYDRKNNQVESLHMFAQEYLIPIQIEERMDAVSGVTFFGKKEWETYFGSIEHVPSLPANIRRILDSTCPFNPTKKIKETHMLVLIPATVNEQPLNLNTLRRLVRKPKEGHRSEKGYDYIHDSVLKQLGKIAPIGSYWVLMTKDVFTSSRGRDYVQQRGLLSIYSKHHEVPDFLSAAVCMLTHFVRTGTCLFSRNPWTFTRCKEKVRDHNGLTQAIVVGGLTHAGLQIGCYDIEDTTIGAAGLWKLS